MSIEKSFTVPTIGMDDRFIPDYRFQQTLGVPFELPDQGLIDTMKNRIDQPLETLDPQEKNTSISNASRLIFQTLRYMGNDPRYPLAIEVPNFSTDQEHLSFYLTRYSEYCDAYKRFEKHPNEQEELFNAYVHIRRSLYEINPDANPTDQSAYHPISHEHTLNLAPHLQRTPKDPLTIRPNHHTHVTELTESIGHDQLRYDPEQLMTLLREWITEDITDLTHFLGINVLENHAIQLRIGLLPFPTTIRTYFLNDKKHAQRYEQRYESFEISANTIDETVINQAHIIANQTINPDGIHQIQTLIAPTGARTGIIGFQLKQCTAGFFSKWRTFASPRYNNFANPTRGIAISRKPNTNNQPQSADGLVWINELLTKDGVRSVLIAELLHASHPIDTVYWEVEKELEDQGKFNAFVEKILPKNLMKKAFNRLLLKRASLKHEYIKHVCHVVEEELVHEIQKQYCESKNITSETICYNGSVRQRIQSFIADSSAGDALITWINNPLQLINYVWNE